MDVVNTKEKRMDIEIIYDGEYPNLCVGTLVVVIAGVKWQFPDCCLDSGGSASFDADSEEVVRKGKWIIEKWPPNFPNEFRKAVRKAVNTQIPHGCCGGCI